MSHPELDEIDKVLQADLEALNNFDAEKFVSEWIEENPLLSSRVVVFDPSRTISVYQWRWEQS